jgi:hypothetical protein
MLCRRYPPKRLGSGMRNLHYVVVRSFGWGNLGGGNHESFLLIEGTELGEPVRKAVSKHCRQ